MNDIEIDEVLKALGGVATPAGLEERVMRRLAAAPVRRTWFAGWMVVSGAALAAMLVTAVMVGRRAPAPRPHEAAVAGQRATPEPVPTVTRVMRQPVVWHEHRAPVVLRVVEPTAVEAASFPAPPMPLTEQEKALLAVVRGKDLPKFAPMNPENRDELIAQGKAEFDEFFPQPKPQETYDPAHSFDR